MKLSKILQKKSFAVYGLGVTGASVVKYLKKNKVKKIIIWDDNKKKLSSYKSKLNIKHFVKSLGVVDYIVISPGININKIKIKKELIKNKNKIITDLDLLYMSNNRIKSIVVTGSNGKSTTCKLIEHVLNKSKFKVELGGNIGKPVLSLNNKKNSLFLIEASSFQLAYSKFIKPTYGMILNISNDHLDWHGNMKNYIISKFKIFLLQNSSEYSILKDKSLIKIFKTKKLLGKLKTVKFNLYKKIKGKITNKYLTSKINEENISFVYTLSKILKINQKLFIKRCNTFKGLPHRHEVFYQNKNIKFINDSKATSFEASQLALSCNKNILWIVGGQPKLKDHFYFNNVSKNIIKSYIIGKHINFFKNKLKKKIKFQVTKTLKKTLITIFLEIKKQPDRNLTVLFSPASASFDQFKNFIERGNEFKMLTFFYAKKYF